MPRFFLLLLALGAWNACATTRDCERLELAPGEFAQISAHFGSMVHIQLPEPIELDMYSNGELWSGRHHGAHYFLQPNLADARDGGEVVLTLITAARAYDFHVVREAEYRPHCYHVNGSGHRGGLASSAPAAAPAGAGRVAAAAPALAAINTNYRYELPIEAAWDDGRRQFVRLVPRHPTTYAISGPGGAVVDYTYDQATGTYTVNGIYPELRLAGDGAPLAVARQ